MADTYIDLADIGTSREVMLSRPARGPRALIMLAAAVLVGAGVGLAFLPVQQTQAVTGQVAPANAGRTLTAAQAGTISLVGAADGDTVGAGATIIALDTSALEAQLAVLTQQQAAVTADLAGYQQLRTTAAGDTNPFDPVGQAVLYQTLNRYRQDLAQASRLTAQIRQAQTDTRTQAEAALGAGQSVLGEVTARIDALTALAASIRAGTAFVSGEDYAEALHHAWQAGRPDDIPGANAPARAGYDAAFAAAIDARVTDLQTQQTGSATHVAQMTSQLAAPVPDAATAPAAAVTANFLLSALTAEQGLLDRQATLSLQAMDLRGQVEAAAVTAPVAGVVKLLSDWQAGDQVQPGQELAQVVPAATATLVEAVIPADAAATLTAGQAIPCVIPEDPTGTTVPVRCVLDRLGASTTSATGQAHAEATLGLVAEKGVFGYGTSLPAGLPVTLTVTVREITGLTWLADKLGLPTQQP